MERKSRKKWIAIAALAAAAVVLAALYKVCVQRPPFHAHEIAATETAMWQAYYRGDRKVLAWELIKLQQKAFGLTLSQATRVAEHLADAAMKFKDATGDCEPIVLPDLRSAYQRIKEATGLSFDPDEAAKAELAWWVKRRTKGNDSPEQVGAGIGQLYAILYGEPKEEFQKAGLLRARAAHLRDQAGADADWPEVEAMLRESYEALAMGL